MAERLQRLGWILIAVGVACVLTVAFLAPGVFAAALGVVLLAAGAALRLLPARRAFAARERREPAGGSIA